MNLEINLKAKDKEGQEIDKIVRFRLPSKESIELEKEAGKPLMEYLDESSMSMIIKILKYMRRWEEPNFNDNEATKLYDLLIENGWTMKRIVNDIICETLVLCGFLERAEWEKMKELKEEATKRLLQIKASVNK